jgi:L-amino acid N-acyltransferase YncA
MKINIRYADENDLIEIVEIFNQAIKTRSSLGFLNEFYVNERKEWFNEHSKNKYPILVADLDNRILGWVSISPYRKERRALDKTVEVSYFIHNAYKRKGIGSSLLNEMIKIAKELGYETIIAILFDRNIGSIKLLKKNNFKKWGLLPEVAEIDGEKFSHLYYGRKL